MIKEPFHFGRVFLLAISLARIPLNQTPINQLIIYKTKVMASTWLMPYKLNYYGSYTSRTLCFSLYCHILAAL